MNKIYIVEIRRSGTVLTSTARRVISFNKYEDALIEIRKQTARKREIYEKSKKIHEGAAVQDMRSQYIYRYYLEFVGAFNEIIRFEFTITESELR